MAIGKVGAACREPGFRWHIYGLLHTRHSGGEECARAGAHREVSLCTAAVEFLGCAARSPSEIASSATAMAELWVPWEGRDVRWSHKSESHAPRKGGNP